MSSATPAPDHLFVGVDIAARSFTAAWGPADQPLVRPVRFEQTPAGYTALQAALAATAVAPQHTLVVMEATSTSYNRGTQFQERGESGQYLGGHDRVQ
jgi:transposase